MSSVLQQLIETAHPRTMKRLRGAGAVSPLSPIAIATALPYLIGRGTSLGIVLQMNAITVGKKPAIVDQKGTLTWRELDAEVNRFSRALYRGGLKGGDKLALLLRNGREAAIAALAAQRTGIVACPLNTWAKPRELKAVLENVNPDLLVYDTLHLDQIKTAVPEGSSLVAVGETGDTVEGSVMWDDFIDGCGTGRLKPVTRNRGSAKIIIQTSGTTGTPKGAARDSSAAGMGALANLLGTVPYRRDDRVYIPAPLFHSFGLATFTFATALGATMVLPPKFDPEQSLRDIEEHRCTAASFVPVMIRRIVSLDDDVKDAFDLSSLRIVMASGSVLSLDLKKAATELFGDVLYDLYGSTEAGWVAIATPDDIKNKPKSLGRPVEGIEIAIFDNDGNRCEAGQTGEIFVRSNVLFEGYTSGDNKDERDGFMSIGDLGHLDDDGHLYVESRSDDMVIVGGENVYPIEIEEVIEAVDGVSEVTVLGIEDDEYGHVLAAFVVGSASEETIRSACKDELASYKVPRRIEILDELPRTSTGKVIKRELVKELAKNPQETSKNS